MGCSQKRLRDHLQCQQDPFVLRIYLSERRIMLNKVSTGQGSCKSNDKVSRARNAFKFLFDKFISNGQRQHQDEVTSSACRKNEASSLPRISPHLKETTFIEKQEAGGINHQLGRKNDSKQITLPSALSKVSSPNKENEEASTRNGEKDDKLTVILWKFAVRFLADKKQSSCGFIEPQDINGHCFLQLLKNKIGLQSTRKLLYDCMHEAIDLHRKKLRRKKHDIEYISLQQLAKIICDQISSWCQENASDKDFGETNVSEEWNYLELEKRKIATKIEVGITDRLIEETIELLINKIV